MRERQKIGRAPVQLHGDYYFIGSKFALSIDDDRYTKRIERACDEMIACSGYNKNERYGSREPLLKKNLPLLAKSTMLNLND